MWRKRLCKSDHDSHCDANDNVEEDEGIGSDESEENDQNSKNGETATMTRLPPDKEKSGGEINKCGRGKDKDKEKEIESTMTRSPLDKDDEE